MNIAKSPSTGERHILAVEAVAASLEAMPRARHLGGAALELCDESARKVMSGQDFASAVRQAAENIMRWAKDTPLPAEVELFCEVSDEELMELQKKHRFSRLQLIQWTGEMKLQIFESRNTLHF